MPDSKPEVTRADRARAEYCLRSPRDRHHIRVDIVAHWSTTGEWPRQIDVASSLVRDTIREHESVAQAIAEARAEGAAKRGAELLELIDELTNGLENALDALPPKTLDYLQFHAAAIAATTGRALLKEHGRG